MKKIRILTFIAAISLFAACSGNKENKEKSEDKSSVEESQSDSMAPPTESGQESVQKATGEPVPGAEIYLEQNPTGEN
ncbi:MAG: hypothetical protein A2W91_12170 [Bacteroidetes bacterium GWF2_38_335]|nr:MAG: hypothetical protein A2W91_12170 [Bacteroidetes bacterium GWF2_38_335]OFY76928.1 MAG: hypothetical protein A2281_00285 [Bacteroidetes bacterium RIFOXYA12_FULL_38_20]HBS86778.1 hypothetical protein [Bacteroidales bacterium]